MKLWLTDVVKIGFKSSVAMLALLTISLIFPDTALAVLRPLATLIFGNSS